MMRLLKTMLIAAIATSLLGSTAVVAKEPGGKRVTKIVVHPKYAPKQARKRRGHNYGFLPGYRQPPDLSDWRDRRPRYRSRAERYEMRYWTYDGRLLYGWGGAGFHHGRWNGGSFGPCWTWTPIGMMWNCGR